MQTLCRAHRPPAERLPAHAADCHLHVFGPFDRFALAAERAYNVAEAPLGAHERMKAQVGLERTVLVQASGHGTDNRAMLAALAELGPRGRGVAVVAPQTP
ncbi:MAG TPA: amidohydrolase family protein, partial [Burkholderiales bacterium]|nr:amidohydrolase family protein [Burkholderiales bacterium]